MNIVDLFVKYILAAACAFVAMHASGFVRIDNAIGFGYVCLVAFISFMVSRRSQ